MIMTDGDPCINSMNSRINTIEKYYQQNEKIIQEMEKISTRINNIEHKYVNEILELNKRIEEITSIKNSIYFYQKIINFMIENTSINNKCKKCEDE